MNPQIKAQVESKNVEWDLVTGINSFSIYYLKKENLLEPIDYSIVNKKDLIDDDVEGYGAPIYVLSANLVYNANKFKGDNYPKNWADFWNVQKFPGPRTLTGVPTAAVCYNFPFALLASGVPKNNLYPYDLDRAFKKLDEIKPHIRAWWSSGAHSQQLFTDEEVWLGCMWNGRAVQLQKKGLPLKIVWDQGAMAYDYWAVPKNAPHKKAAMEFINFASQAKNQAEFSKRMYYGPVNKKAFDYLTPDVVRDLNTFPTNLNKHFTYDHKWLADNLQMLIERWQKWVSK